jgi:hypothetical protein
MLSTLALCDNSYLQNTGAINQYHFYYNLTLPANTYNKTTILVNAVSDVSKKFRVRITIAKDTTTLSWEGKVFPIDVKRKDVIKCEENVPSFGKSLFKKLSTVDNYPGPTKGKRVINIRCNVLKA